VLDKLHSHFLGQVKGLPRKFSDRYVLYLPPDLKFAYFVCAANFRVWLATLRPFAWSSARIEIYTGR
jgi:hypothetical protein